MYEDYEEHVTRRCDSTERLHCHHVYFAEVYQRGGVFSEWRLATVTAESVGVKNSDENTGSISYVLGVESDENKELNMGIMRDVSRETFGNIVNALTDAEEVTANPVEAKSLRMSAMQYVAKDGISLLAQAIYTPGRIQYQVSEALLLPADEEE